MGVGSRFGCMPPSTELQSSSGGPDRHVENRFAAAAPRDIFALHGLRGLAILLVIPHNADLLRPPLPLALYPAALVMHCARFLNMKRWLAAIAPEMAATLR
jgi:hypothetical protein